MTNGISTPPTTTRAQPDPRRQDLATAGELAAAGVITGLIAGAVMIVVAMISTAVADLGVWRPAELVASLYFGADALVGGAGVITAGVLTHFAASAIFGILFAFLTRGRLDPAAALFAGLVYGLVIWIVMAYLVLPWAVPTMYERVSTEMGWFVLYHLLFGLTLVMSPSLVRSFHRRHVRMGERRVHASAVS